MTRVRAFFNEYRGDLTPGEFQRLFTRDTAEAYRYFTRGAEADRLTAEPWYRRWPKQLRLVFSAFTMRLSPARRVLYAAALAATLLGALQLFRGIGTTWLLIVPIVGPEWVDGTGWLLLGFILMNLLILMEVADRLSLKSDLEVARDIQLAMLPGELTRAGDATVAGVTRPANTVGGDLYDVLPLADGRLVVALGDVAGKGSPAALLMALVVAMLRTLVDEGLDLPRLMTRLNVQVARQSPGSRFITLFCGFYDPRTGELEYVNAGHLPPLLFRREGRFDHVGAVDTGGLALGMFEGASYEAHRATIEPGDTLVLYSDGITEAENAAGRPFEETGLEGVIAANRTADPQALGRAVLRAVERHAGDTRLADDLTTLVLKRTTAN